MFGFVDIYMYIYIYISVEIFYSVRPPAFTHYPAGDPAAPRRSDFPPAPPFFDNFMGGGMGGTHHFYTIFISFLYHFDGKIRIFDGKSRFLAGKSGFLVGKSGFLAKNLDF